MNLKYTIQKAGLEDIHRHLQNCSGHFDPPLSGKVNVADYARKIFTHSITFEAWNEGVLAGLIAIYFNAEDRSAFITNVSVMKTAMNAGIASSLLSNCIVYAGTENTRAISLAVREKNIKAINLYSKFGFIVIDKKAGELQMKLPINK